MPLQLLAPDAKFLAQAVVVERALANDERKYR